MAFKMFNFKNFFVSNHDTEFILEARRGDTPESSVLLDEEDLDFLYQIDYTLWTYAISTRYEVLLEELKKRDAVRKKIESAFVRDFNKLYKTKEDRENISLDSFVDFVNNFASGFNDYGDKVATPVEEKVKLKNWEKDFREEYGEDFDRAKKKGSRSFLHELRYMICGYIVPFAKEKKAYKLSGNRGASKTFVPMHINRLIQKLETTKGEEITLPGNSQKLMNLSRTLEKEVPIEMKKTGSYGFDLGRARTQNISLGGGRSTAAGKTRGFTFPSLDTSKGVKNLIRELAKFNYQRHMGPLPSDENFKKFSGTDSDGSPLLTYRFFSIGRNLEDSFNYDVIKKSFNNKIVEFISKNRTLQSWSKVKDNGFYDIVDSKFRDEIETGDWATTDNETIEYILKNRSDLVASSDDKENKANIARSYVSNWQNISGNRKILNKFAGYFAEKQADHILETGKRVLGPRILDGEDEEARRQSFLRLDSDARSELEKNLSKEELENFIKTGRLPLNLKTINGKKKLVPGDMDYAPVVLPFVKRKFVGYDGEEKEINVPLLKPGMYLSGVLSSKSSNADSNDDVKGEVGNSDSDQDAPEDEKSKPKDDFYTPSTSDRTSVYKLVDDNGEEKEVKVISAKSSGRYLKKAGVDGVYYSIDTKGATRKFGFNRWRKNDKASFIKVWSHPDHIDQVFSKSDVIKKYKQLFGGSIIDIYDDVDPINFYSKYDLPDYYPFVLNGYRIGEEIKIPRKTSSDDGEENREGQYSSSETDPLRLKVIKSNSNPEIMGFPLIIKAINDCLSMKKIVCNNDGNVGFRVWLLENPGRIQDLHDYVVGEVIAGGNKGIWKTFLGDSGEKKSAVNVFCSTIGKWLQSGYQKVKRGSINHGQVGRKSRKNLIGTLSVFAFKRSLSEYQSYLDDLEKKSKLNNSNSKALNSIFSIDVIGDDDDDEMAEWYFPGYRKSENKGEFQADKDNFRPDMENWRFGPPTELRNFLRTFYETNKSLLTQDQKDTLLGKVKEEKEFLVGNGSSSQGTIGTDSYIFNQKILDDTPEDSSLTIKQQIESLHDYTNKIYQKDIEHISGLSVAREKSTKEPSSEDALVDETNSYVKDFKQKFNSVVPEVKKLVEKINYANNVDSNLRKISNIVGNLIQLGQTSNENFVKSASVFYYVLGDPNKDRGSLLRAYTLFLQGLGTETSDAEIAYIRKYPGSNTKSFFVALDSISDMFLSVAVKFESMFDDVLLQMKQNDDYKNSVISFRKNLESNNLIKANVLEFLRSNMYKPGGFARPQGYAGDYFDPIPYIHKLQGVTSLAVRNYGSTLRRIDSNSLSTEPDFSNVGKLKKVEIINIINSKKEISEKSSIAKRIKDYYTKSGRWDSLDSYFKRFIDKNIV
jgi:hypothetical protein